ncbi:MAG TPA: hypothetical protein VHC90_25875 [Bryobacteraceae bacterium]|nr:hypothetical protein [Bryobacteraceae bacterium]
MPPAQQNALVQKYCAVCHTDETRNGGLSLAHYDAAQANPALAAMLLSKLQNNAMGAAGLGLPDKPTRDAWVAATTAQAVGAAKWTVIRTGSVVTASTVRDVALRAPAVGAPVYRLTLACDLASRQGDIELTWAPVPQTGRTFFASVDGNAGIPHVLEGREEKMGNGAAVTTGLAMSTLNVPLPEKTLTIENLFPGETVVFPLSQLNPADRRELAVCLAIRAFESTGKSR